MSEFPDVLSYLHSKGIQTKSASRDEVHIACYEHAEDPHSRGRLYINVSTDPEVAGLHYCQVCGHKGNMLTLMRHFGDEPERDDDDDFNHTRHQILQIAADYYQTNLEAEHLKWLREERGLKAATVMTHQLGWADGGLYKHLRDQGFELADMVRSGMIALSGDNQLQADGTFVLSASEARPYDFLRDCITIPYHVAGNVVMIRGKKIEKGGKYLTPPKQVSRLFNTDACWNTDTAVLTEGEFDAMVVEQMGYSAVGSPGAKMWQDSWDGYFDGMRRIYCVFDNDAPGQLGATAIKERLGRKVRNVIMPDGDMPAGDNDISEWFGRRGHSPDEFSAMLHVADRAGTLLVTVDEAMAEWEAIQSLPGLKYGFEAFDDYVRPGHQAGAVWVVLAKTNVGKTLYLLNVFQRLTMVPEQKDAKVLFVSLEQTRGEWFERSRRIWNLYNLNCPALDVNRESANYWRNRIMLTDVNRMGIDELIGAIDDFTEEMGQKPDLVAVDYLGYWARSFKGVSKYEQVSEAVMSLKEVAKERLVRVLAPHQVSRSQEFGKEIEVDSGRDSGAIEETADGVFSLWNPDNMTGKDLDQRTGKVKLKNGKTRVGGKGRVTDYQFGYLSLAMVPVNDPLAQLLVDEIEYDNEGGNGLDPQHPHVERVERWEAAMFRHRSGFKSGDISKWLLEERGLTV